MMRSDGAVNVSDLKARLGVLRQLISDRLLQIANIGHCHGLR